MSKDPNHRPPPQARGRNPSRSRRPKDSTQRPSDDEPPQDPKEEKEEEQYPNYSYSPDRRFLAFLLLLFEAVSLCFLFAVVFLPPNTGGGGLSILKNTASEEYVGVLRRCTTLACDPWMGGTSSESSSGSSSTTPSGDTPPARRDLLSRAEGDSTATDTASAAGSAEVDFPNMFLTTGLATLAALWLVFYTFAFTAIRILLLHIPPKSDNQSKNVLSKPTIKRFIYRIPRAFLFVTTILLFAICLDCITKGIKYRDSKGLTGAEGVGPGIALILLSGVFILLSTLIELRTPGGRTHQLLLRLGCGTNCSALSGWNNDHVRSRADRIGMSERGESRRDNGSKSKRGG